MTQELFLPPGYFAWSAKFGGASLPTFAVTTGCGVNAQGYSASAIAGLIRDRISADVMPGFNTETQLLEVYARLGSANNTGAAATATSNTLGQVAGAAVSPAVTFLAKLYTDLGGKRGRGRWFLPGLIEADITSGGIINATKATNLATALNAFRTALAVAGIPLAVGHRYDYPTDQTITALAPSTVTSIVVDARAATQRNRQRR